MISTTYKQLGLLLAVFTLYYVMQTCLNRSPILTELQLLDVHLIWARDSMFDMFSQIHAR